MFPTASLVTAILSILNSLYTSCQGLIRWILKYITSIQGLVTASTPLCAKRPEYY